MKHLKLYEEFQNFPPLNEEASVTFNDYLDAFNKIITPWMTDMQKKLIAKGFTCKVFGDNNCDENLYGFKLFKTDVESQKYHYYFPYEAGINLQLRKNEDDTDPYFSVFSTKNLGVFGRGAKSKEEINKAAQDSIKSFTENILKDPKIKNQYPK